MILDTAAVSIGPVLFAAVISFIFGFLWYSPLLFGNLWMKLSGVKPPGKGKKPEGMGQKMLTSFVGTLLSAYVIAMLLGPLGVKAFSDAVEFGFFMWLGFMGTTTILGSVLWDGKPWRLWLLNSAYWFLNIILITLVLL